MIEVVCELDRGEMTNALIGQTPPNRPEKERAANVCACQAQWEALDNSQVPNRFLNVFLRLGEYGTKHV